MLWTKSKGALPLTRSFTAGPDWMRVAFAFSDFGTDAHDLKAILFAELAVPGKFTFEIDEVRLEPSAAPEAPLTEASSIARAFLPEVSRRQGGPVATSEARSSEGSNWNIEATSYFWLQGIHGNVDALGRSVEFRANPKDLAGYANFGLSGVVETRYKRLILANDILWTPLTITRSGGGGSPLPPGLTAQVKFNPLIVTHEVGYRLIDTPGIKVDALTGVRHWHLGPELSLTPDGERLAMVPPLEQAPVISLAAG
jgi:hypothetical protein